MGNHIFANHISDKGLIPQICKELIHLNKQKELIAQFLNRLLLLLLSRFSRVQLCATP